MNVRRKTDQARESSREQGGGESRLSRWARQKAANPEPASGGTPAQELPGPTADNADAPLLRDEDMPAIESLDENSDYSGFLSPEVSDGLRKLALRKLFSSAKFNVVDGLDDYDDDFRSFAALGDIVTSDMRHRMEVEAEKARLKAEQQALAESESEADEAGEQDQSARSGEPADADAKTGDEAVADADKHSQQDSDPERDNPES